jgi:16S rRNA processing protein RimM
MSAAEKAASPSFSASEYLVVGKLRRPHGLQGEILTEVLTDFPERLKPGVTLYAGSAYLPLQIKKVRWQNQAMLISFIGYESLDSVGELRNQNLFVPVADRPALADGEFYHHQMTGLRVFTQQGDLLGEITQILETGANDVFVIQPKDGREILIPDTDEVVLKVDLEKGQMTINLLPGLLPDETN